VQGGSKAHIRRGFYDCHVSTKSQLAGEALSRIRTLYSSGKADLILIVDETATDTSAAGDRDEDLVEVASG
jgi:hypothetical protein